MTAAISIIELKPPAVRAVTAFDYGALAPDVAAEIRRQATQIKSKITKTTQDLIVIGRDLEAVKERLDHGQFTTWVESELGIVVRTAQLYMAVARLAKDKGKSISLLPSPTVHRLAAKSTPPEVVAEVVARANSGEILPDAVVKDMVSEAKCLRREAERREREKVRSNEESKHTREKRERWKHEQEEEARQQRVTQAAKRLVDELGSAGAAMVVEVMSGLDRFAIVDAVQAELTARVNRMHPHAAA